MAQRLPFGQVSPGAQPIGAFLRTQKGNVAQAARPAVLGSPSQISTLQQAGTSNVQGFNQFDDMARSLAPFSNALTKLAGTGMQMYATSKIEEGYYAELKNQQVRSMLSLQMQQERGATEAASEVNAIARVDPPAAQLLQESNPWRAIGRRRALAQMAGSEVKSTLANYAREKADELSALPPGSPELMGHKVQLTQKVLSKFGLTGEEPEAVFYTSPVINKAWDDYSEKHLKYYEQELEASTVATTVAGTGSVLLSLATDGVTVNGQTYAPGTPEWTRIGATLLTTEIDKQLGMLAGTARINAVKELKKQLISTYGQDPLVRELLSEVRDGHAGMPMDKRPTWGGATPLDVLEYSNNGLELRQQQYDLGQKAIEQELDGLWYQEGMPGSILPNSPEYPAALIRFRKEAAKRDYRDFDRYISTRADASESVAGRAYAVDPLQVGDFELAIETAPPTAFTSQGGMQAMLQEARNLAARQPTPQLQAETYARLRQKILDRASQAEEFTPGVQRQIDTAVLQDMALPSVKALVDKAKGSGGKGLMDLVQQGTDAATAVSGLGDAALSAFSQRVQNGMMRAAEQRINEWYEANPGRALSPAAKNVLVSSAIADYRKSKDYADAYTELTGKKPGEVGAKPAGPATPGPAPDTGTPDKPKPVNKNDSRALSDQTARSYAKRPVMEGAWLHGELKAVADGKPVSSELYGLAKRSGTSVTRYLLEQLKFYPQLDPSGDARRFLTEKLKQERAGRTVASAQLPSTRGTGLGMAQPFNPLRPGGWLMRMLSPRPAAAATLPPALAVRSGGAGGAAPGDHGGLASLVRSGEGSYNSVNYGKVGGGTMNVTGMTIGQLEKMQARGEVFAVGAYQFTPGPLAQARRDAGLSPNTLMTPEVQDRLFWGSVLGGKKRPALTAYLTGKSNNLNAAHQDLAQEWAAVQGPSGRGAYDGDAAGNYASLGATRIRQALINARKSITGGR